MFISIFLPRLLFKLFVTSFLGNNPSIRRKRSILYLDNKSSETSRKEKLLPWVNISRWKYWQNKSDIKKFHTDAGLSFVGPAQDFNSNTEVVASNFGSQTSRAIVTDLCLLHDANRATKGKNRCNSSVADLDLRGDFPY